MAQLLTSNVALINPTTDPWINLDGRLGAPAGVQAQYPRLFTDPNGGPPAGNATQAPYVVRPPWKVAGVDYGVGVPAARAANYFNPNNILFSPANGFLAASATTSGNVLHSDRTGVLVGMGVVDQLGGTQIPAGTVVTAFDPVTLNVTISNNVTATVNIGDGINTTGGAIDTVGKQITFTASTGIVLDGYNFNGWQIFVNEANSPIFQNCNLSPCIINFNGPNNLSTYGDFCTIRYCIIDAGGLIQNLLNLNRHAILRYCWLKNAKNNTLSCAELDMKYCLVENSALTTTPSDHCDLIQTFPQGVANAAFTSGSANIAYSDGAGNLPNVFMQVGNTTRFYTPQVGNLQTSAPTASGNVLTFGTTPLTNAALITGLVVADTTGAGTQIPAGTQIQSINLGAGTVTLTNSVNSTVNTNDVITFTSFVPPELTISTPSGSTEYYVVSISGGNFQVSATLGGAAIVPSVSGAGLSNMAQSPVFLPISIDFNTWVITTKLAAGVGSIGMVLDGNTHQNLDTAGAGYPFWLSPCELGNNTLIGGASGGTGFAWWFGMVLALTKGPCPIHDNYVDLTGFTNGFPQNFVLSSGTSGSQPFNGPITERGNILLTAATSATFQGTGSGTTLQVLGGFTGYIQPGDVLTAAGAPVGTKILSQISGPTGGIGNYQTDQTISFTNVACTTTVAAGTVIPTTFS